MGDGQSSILAIHGLDGDWLALRMVGKQEMIIRLEDLKEVEAAHPGWIDLCMSAEFRAWCKAAPKKLKKLIHSEREIDAIKVLSAYKSQNSRPTSGA